MNFGAAAQSGIAVPTIYSQIATFSFFLEGRSAETIFGISLGFDRLRTVPKAILLGKRFGNASNLF